MFVLLMGPKGSGKSHIGRLLEQHLGVFFFHVEPLWMRYYADCQAAGCQPVIAEGIARVHPLIVDSLRIHKHVCVETTGASGEILNDLLSLEHSSRTLVVRVSAPLDLCLERIAARDQTNQIPMDVESIRSVYALSEAVELQACLTLKNTGLAEDEIISLFRSALDLRASNSFPITGGFMSEDNKARIREFIERVLTAGEIEATGHYFHDDVKEEVPFPGQGPGLHGLKETLARFRHAFPDSKWNVEEQIAEANKVLTRFIWSGTHQGEFLGIPATNRSVRVWGMVIDRFEEGKVKSTRILLDTFSMMQQLGVVPGADSSSSAGS